MISYLIYDKYAGNHTYHNEYVKNINIDDLKDGTYKIYYCNDAIKYYNEIFHNLDNNIPDFEKSDNNIYTTEIYEKFIDHVRCVITIIGIDVDMLEKIVIDGTDIPHINFLRDLCLYHSKYTEFCSIFTKKNTAELIEKNKNFILEKSIEEVDYVFDEKMRGVDEYINTKLYHYQKCSLKWMIDIEKKQKKIKYHINKTVNIGKVYYDFVTKKFGLKNDRASLTFNGGILADEVGLGKTLTTICAALLHPAEDISYTNKFEQKMRSRATIIICPSQLTKQWKTELESRVTKNIHIICIRNKKEHQNVTYEDILNADFVIVAFQYMINKFYTEKWTNISLRKNWSSEMIDDMNTFMSTTSKNLIGKPFDTLKTFEPIFHVVKWHRIVVDEFHEVYTNKSYNYMDNILRLLDGYYKWGVTATPFADNNNLYKYIDFITNYENKYNDSIFRVHGLVDHFAYNILRKNTKNSISKEYHLPKIHNRLNLLTFSYLERTMYNAYIADPNNDKFDKYLRQICCHYQIADETKHLLSNCKTLEEIRETMLTYFKKNVDVAIAHVTNIENKIIHQNQMIELAKSKRKDKIIKKNNKSGVFPIHIHDIIDTSKDYPKRDSYLNILIDKKIIDIDTLEDPQYILDMISDLDNKKIKLIKSKTKLDGKITTLNFYENVLVKLKKILINRNINTNISSCYDETFDINNMSVSSSSDDDDDDTICVICNSTIDEAGVTKCGHIFCYECLKLSVNKTKKCPYCNEYIDINQIFILSYMEEENNDKNDLVNTLGTKLANLIEILKSDDERTIVFSQWDDLLYRIGITLKENGVNNAFLKGNCYQRQKAIDDFNNTCDMNVIMLSSKNSASGINLTKASRVIFVDPIYGNDKFRKEQEKQAIGRAHRMGQTKEITVIRLIIKNSVEEEIYNLNVKNDLLL
jgi:SNF2 family DNA or RNA helicase